MRLAKGTWRRGENRDRWIETGSLDWSRSVRREFSNATTDKKVTVIVSQKQPYRMPKRIVLGGHNVPIAMNMKESLETVNYASQCQDKCFQDIINTDRDDCE